MKLWKVILVIPVFFFFLVNQISAMGTPNRFTSYVTVNKNYLEPNDIDEVEFTIRVFDENYNSFPFVDVYVSSNRGIIDHFPDLIRVDDNTNVYRVQTNNEGFAKVRMRSSVNGQAQIGFALNYNSAQDNIYEYLNGNKSSTLESIQLIDIININIQSGFNEKNEKENNQMLDKSLQDAVNKTGKAIYELKSPKEIIILEKSTIDYLLTKSPLILNGNNFEIEIPLNLISLKENSKLKLEVNNLNHNEKQPINDKLKKLNLVPKSEYNYVQLIVKKVEDAKEQVITKFEKPIKVTFSFYEGDAFINSLTAINSTNNLIKLGGEYDRQKRIFSFKSSQSGTFLIAHDPYLKIIDLKIGNPIIKINSKEYLNSTPPFTINNVVFVPLRLIGESLGAEILFKQKDNKIEIFYHDKILTINLNPLYVGNNQQSPVYNINGKVFISSSYLLNFGVHMHWFEDEKQLIIVK